VLLVECNRRLIECSALLINSRALLLKCTALLSAGVGRCGKIAAEMGVAFACLTHTRLGEHSVCVLQRVLQSVAACCSVLQCVAACCSVLQMRLPLLRMLVLARIRSPLRVAVCVAVWCSVL